jgi:hypothetical protein
VQGFHPHYREWSNSQLVGEYRQCLREKNVGLANFGRARRVRIVALSSFEDLTGYKY